MSGTMDQTKGRLKEAAGVLTGDAQLKREGKLDQRVGKMKDKTEKAIDKMKDVLTGIKRRTL